MAADHFAETLAKMPSRIRAALLSDASLSARLVAASHAQARLAAAGNDRSERARASLIEARDSIVGNKISPPLLSVRGSRHIVAVERAIDAAHAIGCRVAASAIARSSVEASHFSPSPSIESASPELRSSLTPEPKWSHAAVTSTLETLTRATSLLERGLAVASPCNGRSA